MHVNDLHSLAGLETTQMQTRRTHAASFECRIVPRNLYLVNFVDDALLENLHLLRQPNLLFSNLRLVPLPEFVEHGLVVVCQFSRPLVRVCACLLEFGV